MALTDSLVRYYALEERFEEEIHAVNSVPPNASPLGPQAGSHLISVDSAVGKVGRCAELSYAATAPGFWADDAPAFRMGASNKTFALWFKLKSHSALDFNYLFRKGGGLEYEVFINSSRQVRLFAGGGLTHNLTTIQDGVWYFLVITHDVATSTARIFINGVVVEGTVGPAAATGSFNLGSGIDAYLDEFGIWDRILTAEEINELYNGGDGTTYAEFSATHACRELECCDDNPADYASLGGEGKGYDSLCEPLPRVLFEPLSGTRLIMPSLVTLRTDTEDAVIHYTTDGTAPDRNSAIYTSPLTVPSPATVIRAIAIVEGCPEGPEANAQYQQWSPAAHFTYACTTTDKSGQWGAFAADGNADYNWELQIQFSAITGVKEFTVLQLGADGKFLGAAWSTNEFIHPWEYDHAKQFRAFPLVLFTGGYGGAQQNVAYHTDYSAAIGNFGIGAHTLSMAGSPFFSSLPAGWLFKILITLQDGSTIVKVVDNVCDALPAALCPIPTITSITPQCGPPLRLDLTFAVGVGIPFGISRRVAGVGSYVQITSGVTVASPQTFQDNTVSAGVIYEYSLVTLPAGCVTEQYSDIYLGQAIPNAAVSIAASASTIDSGQNVTISWNSINNNGTVNISPTIGVQPGNTPGSQVVAPAVTTTYEITGQNVCGTVATAQVTVNVNPPATCGASQPSLVLIHGYFDNMFINALSFCSFDSPSAGDLPWAGRWIRDGDAGTCRYVLFETQLAIFSRFSKLSLASKIEMTGGQWVFELYGAASLSDTLIWRGTKSHGSTPLGVYTRTSGCSLQPSTLELV